MADIQIDATRAERIIAQILRDERRLLSEDANALAANICRRLSRAMATPTDQPLARLSNQGFTTAWQRLRRCAWRKDR